MLDRTRRGDRYGVATPRRVWLTVAGAALLAACHPHPQLVVPPQTYSAELTLTCEGPNYVLIGVGDHAQLTPSLLVSTRAGEFGCKPQLPDAVSWTVADAKVARVNRSGRVVGLAPGNTTVTAVGTGALRAVREVHVLPPVARIAWTPAHAEIAVGDTVRLVAAAYDVAGRMLDRIPPLAFTDEAEQGAELVELNDDTGTLVRGVRPGYLRLVARLAHRVDTAVVRVVSARVP